MNFDGKVALVTGAGGRGIGRATSMMFAKNGAKVLVNDVNQDGVDETAQMIKDQGGEAIAVSGDVSVAADFKGAIETAVESWGRFDILVNNAIANRRGTAVELSEEDWDRTLAVGLKALFLGSKYAIPHMIEAGGGSIVNISSVHALVAAYTFTSYAAAKAGVLGLTRQLAVQYGPFGIRTNSICPGMINPRADEWSDELKAASRACYPLRKVGKPDDIAAAILFLSSDLAGFINGANLTIDGGLTAMNSEEVLFDRLRMNLDENGQPRA